MICKYKATITGNKVFLREYEVDSSMSLYRIHEFLQNDLELPPDQMVAFHGLDTKGSVISKYGLFDMGDGAIDAVTLEQTMSKGESSLKYVYNMNIGSFILLTFISQEEELPRVSYPRLVAEKGGNPDQLSANYDDYLDMGEESEDLYDESELPEGEEKQE